MYFQNIILVQYMNNERQTAGREAVYDPNLTLA